MKRHQKRGAFGRQERECGCARVGSLPEWPEEGPDSTFLPSPSQTLRPLLSVPCLTLSLLFFLRDQRQERKRRREKGRTRARVDDIEESLFRVDVLSGSDPKHDALPHEQDHLLSGKFRGELVAEDLLETIESRVDQTRFSQDRLDLSSFVSVCHFDDQKHQGEEGVLFWS